MRVRQDTHRQERKGRLRGTSALDGVGGVEQLVIKPLTEVHTLIHMGRIMQASQVLPWGQPHMEAGQKSWA